MLVKWLVPIIVNSVKRILPSIYVFAQINKKVSLEFSESWYLVYCWEYVSLGFFIEPALLILSRNQVFLWQSFPKAYHFFFFPIEARVWRLAHFFLLHLFHFFFVLISLFWFLLFSHYISLSFKFLQSTIHCQIYNFHYIIVNCNWIAQGLTTMQIG